MKSSQGFCDGSAGRADAAGGLIAWRAADAGHLGLIKTAFDLIAHVAPHTHWVSCNGGGPFAHSWGPLHPPCRTRAVGYAPSLRRRSTLLIDVVMLAPSMNNMPLTIATATVDNLGRQIHSRGSTKLNF